MADTLEDFLEEQQRLAAGVSAPGPGSYVPAGPPGGQGVVPQGSGVGRAAAQALLGERIGTRVADTLGAIGPYVGDTIGKVGTDLRHAGHFIEPSVIDSPEQVAAKQAEETRRQEIVAQQRQAAMQRGTPVDTDAARAQQQAQPFAQPMRREGGGGGASRRRLNQLLEQRRAMAGEAVEARQGFASQKDTMLGETEQLHQQWADEQKAYAETLGQKGDAVHKRFQELDQEFNAIRDEIKGSKIEVLGGFDKTSKALLVVAAALEGGAAASLRRPANTAGLLRMAVNTDLRTQRQNLQKKMADLNLTAAQRGEALRRWDKLESRKRTAALRASQLQIAKLGIKSERLDNRLLAANSVLAIRDQLSKEEVGREDAKIRAAQAAAARRAKLMGRAALPGKLEKEDDKRINDARGLTKTLADYNALLGKFGGGLVKGTFHEAMAKLPGSEQEEAKALLGKLALESAGAISGKGITPGERKTFEENFGRFSDTIDIRRAKSLRELNRTIDSHETMAQRRARSGNYLAAAEFAESARGLKQARDQMFGAARGVEAQFGGVKQ